MNPAIYYLLFLLTSGGYEGPLGVYRDLDVCQREGKEVAAIADRKHVCRPATETAIRYLAGKCLGDQQLCSFLWPEPSLPKKPKEDN